ncbi:MAG: hypothetical protein V1857_03095 [archaeon]
MIVASEDGTDRPKKGQSNLSPSPTGRSGFSRPYSEDIQSVDEDESVVLNLVRQTRRRIDELLKRTPSQPAPTEGVRVGEPPTLSNNSSHSVFRSRQRATEDTDTGKMVDVLLAEYQACHMNSAHFESLRWTSGSILLVASVSLLVISFVRQVADDFRIVLAFRVCSLALFLVWFAYDRYIDPVVTASLDRCYEIEKELRELGFVSPLLRRMPIPRLFSSIKARRERRGTWATLFVVILIVILWTFLFVLFFKM